MIYDVAIIGGGVAGLSVAAQMPSSLCVVLLEMEGQLGYHSSGRSAALFTKTYGPPPIRALTRQSQAFMSAKHALIDGQPLLSQRGALFTGQPQDADSVRRYASDMGSNFGERLINPEQAVALNGLLDPTKLGVCFYEPQAADIDVDLLLTLYRKMAQRNAVEVMLNAAVQRMVWREQGQGREQGNYSTGHWELQAGGAKIQATTIVNAAGAWADQVAALAGAKQKGLVPKRRSVGVVPLPENLVGLGTGGAMLIDIAGNFYVKPEAGRLLISPADETPVPPHDAYADDEALAHACWHAEQVSSLRVERMLSTWGGLRTFAPHGNPVIGRDAGVRNFVWSAGQGGYGIQTSPAWGRAVVEQVVSKTA